MTFLLSAGFVRCPCSSLTTPTHSDWASISHWCTTSEQPAHYNSRSLTKTPLNRVYVHIHVAMCMCMRQSSYFPCTRTCVHEHHTAFHQHIILYMYTCTCNSCLMVFTVYGICTVRGLYVHVLPRAECMG